VLSAAFEWGRRRLLREGPADGMFPAVAGRLGIVWVGVSVPFTTAVAFLADTPDSYLFVWVYMASGAYTAPALVAGWLQVRRAPAHDRTAYALLYAGLVSVFGIGVAILLGLVVGRRGAPWMGMSAVALSGALHCAGLLVLMRRRSGRLRLSIDVMEAAAATVALGAPFVVLAAPAIADAEARWFALSAAASVPFVTWGVYCGLLLLVRLGRRHGTFEACICALVLSGGVNAVLQTAQGVTGFGLPAPPLIALHAVCMSMYLLIPLNVPLIIRPGLGELPPQSQVRGGRMAAFFVLIGLVALLVSTVAVADEHPWTVPFSLAAVSVLLLLALLRQTAAGGETRRLYRQVEEASDQRRRLVAQLLERAEHERRHFADQLYEQALAAYTSFSVMAGSDGRERGSPSLAAEISARVGGDFARTAQSVHELVLAIRPLEGEPTERERLGVPIRAYLADIYGDRTAPRLTVDVAETLSPDWMTETVVLQIVQEALHNVRRHSRATSVDVVMDADGDAVRLQVTDDGVGFDPVSVPEGSGIATMRASAAVVRGALIVESHPGGGTVITARLGSGRADDEPPAPAAIPTLRLVPDPSD